MRKKPWRLLAENGDKLQCNLLRFLWSSKQEIEAYENARKLASFKKRRKQCEEYIATLLAIRPMTSFELWYGLDFYYDVRESVVAEMKLMKMIKTFWAFEPVEQKAIGAYTLNKTHEKVRKILDCR